ncbi:hypothetical protein DPEC_G00278640 [Dallia pectoralis]|uniref:Uncharacterized protein n=1 Tax=Dallia pectoralis TaxID=75939 RepID=A0ACC2FM96_DALPE|nr:hypothetical protein DPEC_G00278640 [Dallia pectoralis]
MIHLSMVESRSPLALLFYGPGEKEILSSAPPPNPSLLPVNHNYRVSPALIGRTLAEYGPRPLPPPLCREDVRLRANEGMKEMSPSRSPGEVVETRSWRLMDAGHCRSPL